MSTKSWRDSERTYGNVVQHCPGMANLSSQAESGVIGKMSVHGGVFWGCGRDNAHAGMDGSKLGGQTRAESPQTLAGTPHRLCVDQSDESNILELAKLA